MKYGTAFLLVLFICIACVHAAPPTQSCAQSFGGSCGNWPNGKVSVYLNVPVSDQTKFLRGNDELHPTIRSLPDPYSAYTGYELGFSPGTYTITVRRPGYNDAAFSTQVCDCKYSFVSVVMVPAVTTTVTTVRPGYVVNPVISGIALATTTPASPGSYAGMLKPPTIALQMATTTAATGGSQAGGSGSQNTGTGSTGTGQTGSSSTGSGSVSQQTGTGAAGNTATANTGILSVTTTPAGAYVFIDGAQRGVTPATISGLAPGDHTLLLKMDGYQDLTSTVTIIAGQTQPYSSGLVPVSAAPVATKKSPGFEFVLAFAGLGAVLCMRKGRAG